MSDYQQPQADWDWYEQLLDRELLEDKDQASQQVLASLDNDFNKLFVGSSDNGSSNTNTW